MSPDPAIFRSWHELLCDCVARLAQHVFLPVARRPSIRPGRRNNPMAPGGSPLRSSLRAVVRAYFGRIEQRRSPPFQAAQHEVLRLLVHEVDVAAAEAAGE